MTVSFIILWLIGSLSLWMLHRADYRGPDGTSFNNDRLEQWYRSLSYEGMRRVDHCFAAFMSLIWPLIAVAALLAVMSRKIMEYRS